MLDIGSGFGDFVNYLKFEGIKTFKYTGIDLVEEFINKAKINHPQKNIEFITGDFLSIDISNKFDFCIASGTFNLRMDGIDGYKYIESNLTKMFETCRIGIAVNFITDKVDYKHDHNFNSSPEEILTIAYKLSKRIVLRNDTFPFEFSIIIYKDDTFRKEKTLFTGVESENAVFN
ncbi:class I SAM-dependent methyltransferase [Opitutales bacterium]|nr:class I SAM-dependent methyltransferase [Opitutales bacterium]